MTSKASPDAVSVSSDAAFLGGEPVFTGTHIPVRLIMTQLECGEHPDDLISAYAGALSEEMIGFAKKLTQTPSQQAYKAHFRALLTDAAQA